MSGLESAEDFARRMVEAVEDDHLLSREALPVYIAQALQVDRNAVRLALLEEIREVARDIWGAGDDSTAHSALEALEAKYSEPAAGNSPEPAAKGEKP